MRAEIDQLKSHNNADAAAGDRWRVAGQAGLRADNDSSKRLKTPIPTRNLKRKEALADAKLELREAAARQKRTDGDDRQGGGRPPAAPANPTMAAGAAAWLERNQWYLSGQNTRLALRRRMDAI
ncbi:MAG: hypothetical protein IPK63_17985 [Candidatus Competibacteraceae bacterium]|nr:hypothetical protein [Candidatus Competibacteraceae bacterium]